MELAIHLLGVPRVLRDGVALPGPRGHKAWGLLAYLLCADSPASREHLAGILFEDADDPLGALRWNLSELRRLLPDAGLDGPVPSLRLPVGTWVDVHALARGPGGRATDLPGLGRELLEGMRFGRAAAFATWLDAQRRQLAGRSEALLREAALARLAHGEAQAAASLASRLVQLNPLDEGHQALLVRSLCTAGDGVGAARQVAACTRLFRNQLGTDPGPGVAAALRTTTAHPFGRPASGLAAASAQLEAGEAAVRAGATEAGLECLRRAVAEADALGSRDLRVRARVGLGSALVHALRGRDEEGALALHEALAIAGDAALPDLATACRELSYVEFLRGCYERASAWLDRAGTLAADHGERRAIATLRGSILSDTAHYPEALALLRDAAAPTEGMATRQEAYALSMLGRVHLLCGDLDQAAGVLDRSVALARSTWTAFLPWPQSLRAEVDLLQGDPDRAAEAFEAAFALGCQLGDPCWEGIAGRGRGLVAAARRQPAAAVQILEDALARCSRLPDAYLWTRAYTLEALCRIGAAAGRPETAEWVEQLYGLASRTGMRQLLALAYRHRETLAATRPAAPPPAPRCSAPSPPDQASRRSWP